MKPRSHTTGRIGIGDIYRPFPVVDSAFQSVTLDGSRGGCAKSQKPSFRNISKDYFKNEARHSFLSEAAFFAAIVVISSWPILLSVRAMTDLVRAYGGF
jgi:hypothetical protein